MADQQDWRWVRTAGRVVLFLAAVAIAGVRAAAGTVDALTVELLAFAAVLLLYDRVQKLSLLGFKVWGRKEVRGVREARRQVVAESGGPVEELRAARGDLDRVSQELAVAYGITQGTPAETIKAAAKRGVIPPAAARMSAELAKLYAQTDSTEATQVTAELAWETSILVGVLRRAAEAAPAPLSDTTDTGTPGTRST